MPEHEPEQYEQWDQVATTVPISGELLKDAVDYRTALDEALRKYADELWLSFTDPQAYAKLIADRQWTKDVTFAALDEKDQRIVVLEAERDTLVIQLENLRFAVREALDAAEDYDPWS